MLNHAHAKEGIPPVDDLNVEFSLTDDHHITERIGQGSLLIFDSTMTGTGGAISEGVAEGDPLIEEAVSTGDDCSIISIPPDKMKINFDIITTKLVNESKRGKYVNYVVMVMEVPKLDTDRAIIERRYSQFKKLHNGLCSEFPNAVRNISIPGKKYFSSNFDDSVIESRARHFERYLRFIYHQPGVIETSAFQNFFYKPHLKEATQLLKCEEYQSSYDEYRLAWQLMRKLGSNRNEIVACMCGVVETLRNMKRYAPAEEIGSECLELLQYDVSNPFLLPLIHAVIDARKRLLMNTDGIKHKLKECEQNTAFDLDAMQTLRELSVKRF